MWKYKIGTVVKEKQSHTMDDETVDPYQMHGHVIGFSSNKFETILKVQWEDGSTRSIHHTNVIGEGDE